MAQRTLAEKIAEADAQGGRWLALANEKAELGCKTEAERLYERGQKWLDRSNKLRGAA